MAGGMGRGRDERDGGEMALLEIRDLRTSFHTRAGTVRAVDGVSLYVDAHETLGIVGESGCGKSVTCYSLLGLLPSPPARVEAGQALFDNQDLLHCGREALRRVRGNRISMIFQDPMTSLNPYLRVSTQLIEPLLVHKHMPRQDALAKAEQALAEVGIDDPHARLRGYPHELSGGMRQRVMIAMALITRSEILIADEPTTALDVTVQAQILELIRALQDERGSAVILVTHDLGVVAGTCDRVAVMYAGRILESGRTHDVFADPQHPYTIALQRSLPAFHRKGEELYTIPGMPPDLRKAIRGCPFAPRCELAEARCREPVTLQEIGPGHSTACVQYQG